MISKSMLVGLTVTATALALTTACGSGRNAPQSTSTSAPATTTVAQPQTTRASCETAVPASWQEVIDGSEVNTGGVSTVPGTVTRAGEVTAVRDNGDTRDVLLIGADKSITEIYAVPDPKLNNAEVVAMDDRWIVIGVVRIPRNSNGVLPGLTRIDVIDRQGGAIRTVAQESENDYGAGRNAIDSAAVFDGKVYWITRVAYSDETGKASSYDLGTGAVADVALGAGHDVRTTAAGLIWDVEGRHAEVKIPDSMPPPVADAVGVGRDRMTLATDGTAYAWLTGVDQGGTGMAWWTPASGLVRVTGEFVSVKTWLPPVYVVGPYVVIGKGRGQSDAGATVVDTRSGAVTYLRDYISGAGGGTIALQLGSMPGVVGADALQPLTC